jgi:hypothetical protein
MSLNSGLLSSVAQHLPGMLEDAGLRLDETGNLVETQPTPEPVTQPAADPSAASPPEMLDLPPVVAPVSQEAGPSGLGGDVFQYNKPEAPEGPSPQDLNLQMLNTAMGTTVSPFLSPLLESLKIQQEQEMQNRKQGLATRGVLNSTPGQGEVSRLRRQQEGAQVGTYLGALGQQLGMQGGVSNQVFAQRNLEGQQDLDNWFKFLQSQQQSDSIRTAQQNQGIALMLNALGLGTINPQMPNFSIPGEAPGAGAAVGNLLGNFGTAAAGSEGFWDWLTG